MKQLSGLIAALLASACTGLGTVTSPADSPASPADTGATTSEPVDVQSQTLANLLEQARDARLAGRLGDAESMLEAALRIAPNDARLWLELAEVQFAAGEFDTARGLAERALALAGNDANLFEAAQRLIAQTSG